MGIIENLETMLANGQDNALLRYGLGDAYLKQGDQQHAIGHLEQALAHDRHYSAAWKLYGKALTEAGRIDEAMRAYETGIAIAEDKGDIQAAKEMRVFLKRLQKQHG